MMGEEKAVAAVFEEESPDVGGGGGEGKVLGRAFEEKKEG